MAQQVEACTCRADNLNLIPGSLSVAGENWLLRVVLGLNLNIYKIKYKFIKTWWSCRDGSAIKSTLPEDPDQCPAPTWWLMIISNSSSKESPFWPLQTPDSQVVYRYTCRQNSHTHKILKKCVKGTVRQLGNNRNRVEGWAHDSVA